MASDIAKKYAAEIRVTVAKWGDATSVHHYEAAIDRAIRASHAQRTRRERKALESARHHVGPIGMQAIRDALRRARGGGK